MSKKNRTKNRIKKWFTDYRQWQRDPFRHIPSPSEEIHHCHCCDNDYTVNYCPTCGQKVGGKHITWASVGQGVMDLWGMGSRSLPYTLWQLIWRPGYVIGDYISGRRQISFPPIKMLVFVALFVFIISNWVNPSNTPETVDKHYLVVEVLEDFFAKHYDWATLLLFSFLIIPTYFIFRYAPQCRFHTIPSGFFIQVFLSIKCLFYFLLINIADALFDVKSSNEFWIDILTFLLFFVMVYRTYKQLFCYGYWPTFWRTAAVIMGGILTLLTLLSLDSTIAAIVQKDAKRLMEMLAIFFPFLLTTVLIIYGAYRISRHTAKEEKS